MPTVALLMLQLASASTSPPAAALSGGAAGPSLLHPVSPPIDCATKTQQIVVCGKDADHYRLPDIAVPPEVAGPFKPEWKLFGNATVGIGASQRVVGGYPSNAIMATIKIPF